MGADPSHCGEGSGGQVAGLRREVRVCSGAPGTEGSRWPHLYCGVIVLQQHYSLAVSAGRVDNLINRGFRVSEKIKWKGTG